MLPDRVLNPGPLTYESGALSIALRGPALNQVDTTAFEFAVIFVYWIILGSVNSTGSATVI